MPTISGGKGILGTIFLAMLMVAAFLFWNAHDNYRAQEQFQRDLATHSVRDAAMEIADYIDVQRSSVAMLAEGRGELLARQAANPSNQSLQAVLDRLLKERFVEYHAFSLASTTGELLSDDMGERIGDVCRQDVARFAADDAPYRPYIHPMPGHYHYDIMARWRDGYEHGIMFISFSPQRLAALLNSNQIPGHRLLLVKAEMPRLIEVTPAGGRDTLEGDYQLGNEDMARIAGLGASLRVAGTQWLVVDVPGAELMGAARQRMLLQMAGIGSVFLVMGGLAAWVLRRELARQAEDFMRRSRYQQELEQRVAERTRDLHEKQIELERAQAISHLGSWKIEYPGERITASVEALRIYGLDPDLPLTQAGVMAVVHPLDREKVAMAWQAMRDGESVEIEFRVVGEAGEKTVHALAHSVKDDAGKVLVVMGTTQDITSRRLAELELRRFRQIVETSGDMLAFLDRELRYQAANPAYASLFDATPESLNGRTVREVFGEDMYALVGAYLDRALAGRDQRFTTDRVFPNGRHHVLDVEYRPFQADNEVLGVVVSIHDISQRVMAERALRNSELKLRAMLNTPFLFIGLLDIRGTLLQVNDTALRMADKKEIDVVGLPFWETPWFSHDAEERGRLRDAVERGAQGFTTRFELSYRTASGEIRQTEMAVQPLRDAEGRVVWLVPQGIDITERKATDTLLHRDREQQATLRGLLEIILKGGSLEETLDRCLGLLLDVSWLSILPKGGVFLLDEDAQTLRLTVSRDLAPEILGQCASLPLGRCHCGRAAATCQMQYAECVDARHEIAYPGMVDHGHYALPLMFEGKPQGVLVLYLPGGFQRDPVKEEFICTVTDILSSFLRRKRDEQALRDSENLTRSVMDSLDSGIAVLDGNGAIIRVNKSWRDFAQENEGDELLGGGIGLNYLEVTRKAAEEAGDDDEGAAEVLAGMRAVLDGERDIFSIEYPCHAPDQERWFLLQVTRLGGNLKGLVTSQTNITQRKLAERELERYQQHLEEIVEARTVELRATEERIRLILESTADGLFGMDLSGLFTFVNPVACAMLGFGTDELIGRGVHRTIHHSRRDGTPYREAECPMLATLRDGAIMRQAEEVFWRADGTPLAVAYSTHPMIRQGEIVGAVVSFSDITERQRIERALRDSQNNLAHAQSIAHVGSWHLDIKHDVLTWSEETYRIFGVAPDSPVNLGQFAAHIHHDDTARVMDAWERALRGEAYDIEHRIVVDGQIRWVREQAEVRLDESGAPLDAVGAVQDISELKAAELATRRSLEEAQHLARVKSEFLANMSHEIRTPLNAVLGLAQVGLRESEKRKSRETFTRILDSGQLLLGIVNDVLDFSKIEAGRLVLEQRQFSPTDVIDRVVAMVADRAYAKGLEFRVDEAADLPAVCAGDDLRLSQVLVNLLSNAVKFTERGRLTLRALRRGEHLEFQVEDNGIGMTAEQLERLFIPFEQADGSTTRRFGGTGLGLAISKRLVDLMGGEFEVSSQPDIGSVFQIRIPLIAAVANPPATTPWRVAVTGFAREEGDGLRRSLSDWGVDWEEDTGAADLVLCAADASADDVDALARAALSRGARVGVATVPGGEGVWESFRDRVILFEWPIRMHQILAALSSPRLAASQVNPGVPRLAGLSVLAAEDNEINRIVLEELLVAEGARLTCLENGREAVEQLRAAGPGAYDIVLTDIQMPVMDGYETARGVHVLDPELPVIGITAHAMAEEKVRCLAAGMVEHVAKPIDLDVLVAAILRHVRPGPAATTNTTLSAPSNPRQAGAAEDAIAPAAGAMIDWVKLEARFNGKRAFVDKLVKTATASQAESPAKLRAAARERDFKALAFLAHGLKGMGGNLMAEELHELAARAEIAARGEASDAADLAERLAQTMERFLAALADRSG